MYEDLIPNKCPVCDSDLQNEILKKDHGERNVVDCNTCGKFVITRHAIGELNRSDKKLLLPSWLREHWEKGNNPPELNQEFLKTLLPNLQEYNPLKKQLMLLRALQDKTEYPGFEVGIDSKHDFPLVWAKNEDELRYYIDALEERGFLESSKVMGDDRYKITPRGWDYLDENKSESSVSDQVFIAMYFADEMSPAWEDGIKPAIEDSGYKPYRIDMDPHIGQIDSKIITEIRNSKFMIADVTKERPNVYFEAGFAKGFGLPVIWCAKKESKLHFDTRQFRHIMWNTPKELRTELYNLICATVGKNE
jgi:DNA-binding PadR family transcriptional regulator